MRARRRLVSLLAVVVLGAPGVSWAAEYRSLTGGVGWGACATVALVPEVATAPVGVDLTADVRLAADAVNAEVGREVLVVGLRAKGATAVPVRFAATSTARANTLAGRATVSATPTRIVAAEVELDPGSWAVASASARRSVLAHEFGHVLGLGHVADAHEVMSYGYVDDGDGLGAGTREALRKLYAEAPCGTTPRIADAITFPSRPAAPAVRATSLGGSARDVREVAIASLQRLAARHPAGSRWATHAVVCRDDAFPDCLAGAGLSGDTAPIVFVPGGPEGRVSATDATLAALRSALPRGGTVYVLGGPNAVSDQVVAQLAATWPDTRRLAGPSRVETAVAVAREVVAVHGRPAAALLARADDFADAVTAGAVAADRHLPILLTGRESLHPAVEAALRELGIREVTVLGGKAALRDSVRGRLTAAGVANRRVAGRSRSETAVAIAREPALWGRDAARGETAFLALNGWHPEAWALALAAAPVGAAEDAPILLTTKGSVPTAPPSDGTAGDTAYYLATLPSGPGAQVTVTYVGGDPWADPHAPASLVRYAAWS